MGNSEHTEEKWVEASERTEESRTEESRTENSELTEELPEIPQGVDYEKLRSGVKTIGVGFLFIYLNLHLGRLNVLPNWVGYLLIREACDDIGEQEPSILLLKPLAALLAAYEGVLWLCRLFNINFAVPAVDVVISVVLLYFNYQLATNLGDLAAHLQMEEAERFYCLRIWQAALTTLLGLSSIKSPGSWIQTALLAATLVVLALVEIAIVYLEGSLKERAQ